MLKSHLAGRALTLKQTRIDFTRCHVEADKSFKEQILKSFQNDHFTFVVGGMVLSPKIRKEIDQTNELLSKYCCVEHDEGSYRVFLASAPHIAHIAIVGDSPMKGCHAFTFSASLMKSLETTLISGHVVYMQCTWYSCNTRGVHAMHVILMQWVESDQ